MVALRTPVIALVGNPNTGKSTLFNALSGMKQHVGNYPGVTVETKKGKFRHQGSTFEVVDLPGTYSLAPRSPDEMVAVEVILGQQTGECRPDLVVTIVDASNLERNLYLTTQVLAMGVPVIIALNMMDVAAAAGIAHRRGPPREEPRCPGCPSSGQQVRGHRPPQGHHCQNVGPSQRRARPALSGRV